MKRLIRKAEIYDGFNYGNNYVEVFKNPTASEIEAVRELDPYNSIRGVIDRSGDKYIWIGEIEHFSINKYMNNQIPTNYFRFAYYGEGWMFYESGHGNKMMLEEFKKIISDNLDFLSQIGSLNVSLTVMGLSDCDKYLSEYNSFEDFLNNKKVAAVKLIKAINVQLQVGDQVQWKRHPYDNSVYEVMEILPNGNVFIDNGINAFTDIKPSVLKLVSKPAE